MIMMCILRPGVCQPKTRFLKITTVWMYAYVSVSAAGGMNNSWHEMDLV